jgi:phosphate-selective porin
MNRLIAMAALAVAFVIASPSSASAQTMTCQVVDIVATKTDQPAIDPDLKDVEKKLKGKAFSAWNTFKQRARLAKQVEKGSAADYDVPGGKVTVTVLNVTQKKKRTRYELDITLQPKSGKSSARSKSKVDSGDFALFARGDEEATITAISCK